MAIWWKCVVGAGVGVLVLKMYMYSRIRSFEGKANMINKVVIITGANCGIGKATALEMLRRGAKVIMACRDLAKAREAGLSLRKSTKNGELLIKELDLASFASIRTFVENIISTEDRLDVLINNAGVFQCPFTQTVDGLELQMAVNYFGHFLLTNMLLDLLKASAPSRVVMVSSSLHKYAKLDLDQWNIEQYYNRKTAYNNSKLAVNLFARKLSQILFGSGVSVYCLHPGMVRTNLGRHHAIPILLKPLVSTLAMLLIKSAYQGCQTVIYCSCAAHLRYESGKYYGNCIEEKWTEISRDDKLAEELWNTSLKITKLTS